MNTSLLCVVPCAHISGNDSTQCPQTSAAPTALKECIPNSITADWGQLCCLNILSQNTPTQSCCQFKCTFCVLLCARTGLMLTPTVPVGMLLCFKSAELGSLFNETCVSIEECALPCRDLTKP